MTTASAPSEDRAKPTLMLLDGNSLAFRAFYALPAENFKTRGGLTTNAVYGFTAMLINLLRDEAPTHIAAAFDVSRQTFRLQRYPEYKANRSSTPDEFAGQIDITKEVLGALGITVLSEPGFEADDLIATLATQAENEGYRVLVVTGDRDALQLVSDDVTVLYPRKGVSELTRFTPEAVVEKYGLTPRQYPDFAALRGDPSDNLPGIPGVGRRPPPNGSPSTARCGHWWTTLTPCAARWAMRCGRTWPAWCATVSSPTWFATCRWPRPRTRCGCSPGIATTFTGSSTTWSFGCCATGCSTRWPRPGTRGRRGVRRARRRVGARHG